MGALRPSVTTVLIVHHPKTALLPQTIAPQSACRWVGIRPSQMRGYARYWVNNSLTFGDEVVGTASQSRPTLATQHCMLLQRNLIYTGITRARSWSC